MIMYLDYTICRWFYHVLGLNNGCALRQVNAKLPTSAVVGDMIYSAVSIELDVASIREPIGNDDATVPGKYFELKRILVTPGGSLAWAGDFEEEKNETRRAHEPVDLLEGNEVSSQTYRKILKLRAVQQTQCLSALSESATVRRNRSSFTMNCEGTLSIWAEGTIRSQDGSVSHTLSDSLMKKVSVVIGGYPINVYNGGIFESNPG